MVSKFRNLKRLIYLISPNQIYPNFYTELGKVLSSNKVSFFQLRLKKKSKNQIIKIAKKIKIITKKHNVKLIINDRTDVAQKINADGCHMGQLDGSIRLAREELGTKIIGITCHGSKKLALIASANNADHMAFGSFFKSKLKPNAKKANLKILAWAKKI